MSRSVHEYLQHVLDETSYLLDQAQQLDKVTFLDDQTLKRAFVRSLEVMGEAVKQIPDDLRQRYNHVEWRAIAGMSDRLIHAYFSVDYELVWDVVQSNIPELQRVIKVMLAQEQR